MDEAPPPDHAYSEYMICMKPTLTRTVMNLGYGW
jgi:hypothetical protein